MARVVCDIREPARINRKVYRTVVMPTLLYSMETVQVTKNTGGRAGGDIIKVVAFVTRSD